MIVCRHGRHGRGWYLIDPNNGGIHETPTEKYENGGMKTLSLSWRALVGYSDKLAAYLENT